MQQPPWADTSSGPSGASGRRDSAGTAAHPGGYIDTWQSWGFSHVEYCGKMCHRQCRKQIEMTKSVFDWKPQVKLLPTTIPHGYLPGMTTGRNLSFYQGRSGTEEPSSKLLKGRRHRMKERAGFEMKWRSSCGYRSSWTRSLPLHAARQSWPSGAQPSAGLQWQNTPCAKWRDVQCRENRTVLVRSLTQS